MGKVFRTVAAVATAGLSEAIPKLTKGNLVGAATALGPVGGALSALEKVPKAPGAGGGPSAVPGVDPAILDLKAKQEAQTAAEEEQRKRRGTVLSEFLRGPASNVSGGGKSVLGSNLFG